MLLALTPNPAIDRTLIVPRFRHSDVTRVTERHDAAGGKGLNVVRVAHAIGLPARACAPLGGQVGQEIARLAHEEGLDGCWHWLKTGESRICLLVSDPATQDTLVINEPGPPMTSNDWQDYAALIERESANASAVASSGSLMPQAPVEGFRSLLQDLLRTGQHVLLDTSGAPLRATLDLPVALLKINQHELADALGQPIDDQQALLAAARQVLTSGPQALMITLGKHGALACDRSGAWLAQTPAIQALSPVGSGDAVLAGAASVLINGGSLPDALCMGVACGAANAKTLGAGRVYPQDVQHILAATTIQPLIP